MCISNEFPGDRLLLTRAQNQDISSSLVPGSAGPENRLSDLTGSRWRWPALHHGRPLCLCPPPLESFVSEALEHLSPRAFSGQTMNLSPATGVQ